MSDEENKESTETAERAPEPASTGTSDYAPRSSGGGGGGGGGGSSNGDWNPDKRNKQQRPRYRRKILDTRNLIIDFKSPETLERFISRTGKILPRRMTGANAKVQRKISREIRRARMINLLPFNRR